MFCLCPTKNNLHAAVVNPKPKTVPSSFSKGSAFRAFKPKVGSEIGDTVDVNTRDAGKVIIPMSFARFAALN